MSGAPPGFEVHRVGGTVAMARPEAAPWVCEALGRGESLHTAALRSATLRLQGRGPVPVILNPTGEGSAWVVRHYHRGGGMRWLGDRYLRLGTPRSFQELQSSEQVRALGVATPRVIAATVRNSGAFYRADLVTEFVYDARELADVVVGPSDSALPRADAQTRVQALTCTDHLIETMTTHGIRHPDLNARNVLVVPTDTGFEAVLLDMDRCSVAGEGTPDDNGIRLRERLVRSLRKIGRERAAELSDEDLGVILPQAGTE